MNATHRRPKASSSPFKNVAVLAARAADDKKGEDIFLADTHLASVLADYVLVVSVASPAHLDAVEMGISVAVEAMGIELRHRDGSHSSLWRVLDFGGLLVHLVHPEAREFYALDKLFRDAPHTRWQEK